MSEPRLGARALVVLVATATLGVLAAYAHTIDFGFHYDDYHVLRPWTSAEAGQVLRGSWDPTQIEVPFYRPVTAWWYALRFHLFALNAPAQRVITIAGMIACAFLAGLYVWRDSRRRRPAIVAAALYGVHPLLPYSQGAWLTNQMHLLASLTVLAALILWQRARAGRAWSWSWGSVFLLQVIGFGIKEDLLMLVPLVLVLTAVRARLVGDVRPASLGLWLGGAALVAGLPLVRHVMLGQLGGYGLPTVSEGWSNFRRGLDAVRLARSRLPLQIVAGVFMTVTLIAGSLGAVLRRTAPGTYLVASGLLTILFFNLPFVLVTKVEQRHLLALGAVIALTGAIEVLIEFVNVAFVRRAVAVVMGLGVLVMVPVTRTIASDFAPCSSSTLYTDSIVTGWWVVPREIKTWLAAKPDACRAGSLVPLPDALSSVTWAHDLEVDETGRPFRWTSDRAVALVTLRASRVVLALRSPTASARQPVQVRIHASTTDRTLTLTESQWVLVEVPLHPTLLSRLRRMHRVDMDISPTFVPHVLDPANGDTRTLGIQIRVVEPK